MLRLFGRLIVKFLFFCSLVCVTAGIMLLHKDTGLRDHARDVYFGLAIVGVVGLSVTAANLSGGD